MGQVEHSARETSDLTMAGTEMLAALAELLDNQPTTRTMRPVPREHPVHKGPRPPLRQAVVAGCAAVEAFCADRVRRFFSAGARKTPPRRMDPRAVERDLDCIAAVIDSLGRTAG